jgi:inorganic pyrophosphatase
MLNKICTRKNKIYMRYKLIIETPALSNVKYTYEPETKTLKAKKQLPLGMVFPYAFGLIKNTKGEDGDPLDAMVISTEKYVTGCEIEARLLGCLIAEQKENGKMIRNDRYFFVPDDDLTLTHIKDIRDFGKEHTEQLQEFFIQYNKIIGRVFRPLRIANTVSAASSLKKLIQPS